MRRFSINIILALVFVLLVAAITLPFRADAKFNAAKDLEQNYRWKKAQMLYESAMRLDPFNSKYPAELARFITRQSTHRKDRFAWLERAEKLYKRALWLNPRSAEYALKLGEIEVAKGAIGKAFENFQRAIKNDPNGFNTAYSIGYAGASVWNFLDDKKKELVLDEIAYALALEAWYGRHVYPLFWRHAKDFSLLQRITPNTLRANMELYNFMRAKNLWQFRRSQARMIDLYRQKEEPDTFKREQREKSRSLRELRSLAMTEGLKGWSGKSWNGENAYENGNMYWNGTINKAIDLPEGASSLKIKAKGSPAYNRWPYMLVELDGEEIGEAFVESAEWEEYIFKTNTGSGRKVLSVTFLNDVGDAKKGIDRNLYVGDVIVNGG